MAAIGLPAGLAGGVVLVGVGDAPVVLFAKFVVGRVGIRIAAQPELLDERIALFVVAQVSKGFALIVRDDVGDVLVRARSCRRPSTPGGQPSARPVGPYRYGGRLSGSTS